MDREEIIAALTELAAELRRRGALPRRLSANPARPQGAGAHRFFVEEIFDSTS